MPFKVVIVNPSKICQELNIFIHLHLMPNGMYISERYYKPRARSHWGQADFGRGELCDRPSWHARPFYGWPAPECYYGSHSRAQPSNVPHHVVDVFGKIWRDGEDLPHRGVGVSRMNNVVPFGYGCIWQPGEVSPLIPRPPSAGFPDCALILLRAFSLISKTQGFF